MVERNVYSTEGWVAEIADKVHDRLKSADGGGTSGGMESRLTRLEVEGEQYRRDIAEIKTSLKKLDDLPTKKDLDSWRWQWLATGIAILALTVGGITGGLALIAKFAS